MNNKSKPKARHNARPTSERTSTKVDTSHAHNPARTQVAGNTNRKQRKSTNVVQLICTACYVEKTIENTSQLLKSAMALLKENEKRRAIHEALTIAEVTLDELLEQLSSKPHGEGLSKKLVPVRPIPVPVFLKQ